jgi:CHAT domain-containing protein
MPSTQRGLTQAGSPPDRAARRAGEAHQRGRRAAATGHPAAGARHLRAGLTLLGWAEDEDVADQQQVRDVDQPLVARLLISLAHAEAEQGRTEYGLRLLDRAGNMATAQDRGILLAQRGMLFMRTWRVSEALKLFDEAVPLLEGYPDTEQLALVLLNRSFLHLDVGAVQRARADLTWCQRVAADGRHSLIAVKATHNLGFCDLLVGDIPAALKLFSAAEDGFRQHAPTWLPVLAVDKARALLAVGLSDDAISELGHAITAFRKQRLDQDLAQAELGLAQAALAAGELDVARRSALAARGRFRRQGNDACAHLAELTRLRARFAAAGRPGPIADEASLLAGKLRGCRLPNDADVAELLAARALLATGRPVQARQRISASRRGGASVTMEVRLLRRLAKSELAELEGRPGATLAELRAGLALVRAHRARLGSIDLQTGAAALGAELAAAGMRQALDRVSAPLLFAGLERSRAQAFRARPVRPPADQRAAEVMAELRQLSYLIRQAELNGVRDPAAIARRAMLQREIRERSWHAEGAGEAAQAVAPGEISAALESSGQVLVSILARDSVMYAVVLRRGTMRLYRIGDFGAASEAARRLVADLDTLAGRRLPARLEAVITQSSRRQIDVLTGEITAPLRGLLGDGGIVIVPTGLLASIPWNMLPDLRGRPVAVCPSASSWLAAWRRIPPSPLATRAGPPLIAAGPDLAHAAAEAMTIAKMYPGSRPLTGGEATVSATLRGLDGTHLAHLAAHGHHEQENFLFSRLDLADGPLMAYDLQQLTAAPHQVILSACDAGRSAVRPGEELLGFTAALLYVGAATVISSVASVGDDTAVGIMTEYHRRLTAGDRPAQALAKACGPEQLSPFVCFGSG